MDARRRRYWRLVYEHGNSPQELAAGIKAVPGTFASTQALWRFLANPGVTLPPLVMPLRTLGCRAASESASPRALLLHDWSRLAYPGHRSKTDRTRLSHQDDVGHKRYAADADQGVPPAPRELQLLCAKEVHATRHAREARAVHHLDQLLPAMRAAKRGSVPRRRVHGMDREADSQADFRKWTTARELFLARADFTREGDWRRVSDQLPELAEELGGQQQFPRAGSVTIRGKTGIRRVAHADIPLSRPVRKRTANGRIKVGKESLGVAPGHQSDRERSGTGSGGVVVTQQCPGGCFSGDNR